MPPRIGIALIAVAAAGRKPLGISAGATESKIWGLEQGRGKRPPNSAGLFIQRLAPGRLPCLETQRRSARSRNQVHVVVKYGLASGSAVYLENGNAVGGKNRAQSESHRFRYSNDPLQWEHWGLKQVLPMRFGNYQGVAFCGREEVHENHGVVVFPHLVGSRRAGDNLAKNAAVLGCRWRVYAAEHTSEPRPVAGVVSALRACISGTPLGVLPGSNVGNPQHK